MHTSKTELYVEVGHGLAPAAAANGRRFDGNRAYLGIDNLDGDYSHVEGKSYGKQVAERLAKIVTKITTEKPGEHIIFSSADGRNLPLADGTATEVYMANVLTSSIPRWHRHELIKEAARVLKPGGTVVTKMSWDPEWLYPRYEAASWLQDAGLTIDEITGLSDSERFNELEDIYGISEHQNPDSYYVIATRP